MSIAVKSQHIGLDILLLYATHQIINKEFVRALSIKLFIFMNLHEKRIGIPYSLLNINFSVQMDTK